MAALAAQVVAVPAYAADVRPAAVNLGVTSPAAAPLSTEAVARLGATPGKRSRLAAGPALLLPLLGVAAAIAVVAVVASGGDDDASPN